MPRLSANLGFLWADRPLLDRIEAASRAGFEAVELHWPYDIPAASVRDACERSGVTLLGINSPPGDTANGAFGLGTLPGREADFQATVDQAIAYAREAGGQSVHVIAGLVTPDNQATARDTFAANLKTASEKADQAGVMLLLEALNPVDRPDYLYASVSQAAEVIDAVGAPNIKLMFDAYHVGMVGEDVLAEFERHLPMIGHVQIASVPDRAEPDGGDVPLGPFLERLDERGYAGWVGCEYKPRAGTDAGLGWTTALGVPLPGR